MMSKGFSDLVLREDTAGRLNRFNYAADWRNSHGGFARVYSLSATETVGCAVLFSCSEPESSQPTLGTPRMRLRARRFSSSARRVTKSGRTQRTPSARCSTDCSGERLG